MPGDVISLDSRRPRLTGEAYCCACDYEWTAIAPPGTVHLECPSCGNLQGMFRNAVEPGDGQDHYRCGCEETLFFALAEGWLLCRRCGSCLNPWTGEGGAAS